MKGATHGFAPRSDNTCFFNCNSSYVVFFSIAFGHDERKEDERRNDDLRLRMVSCDMKRLRSKGGHVERLFYLLSPSSNKLIMPIIPMFHI